MTSHKSMVLIVYVQNHTLNCNANLSSGASDIRFIISPHLLSHFFLQAVKALVRLGK